MANNDSYSDRPIALGDSYSPQQPGYNSYTAAGDSTFLPRISPEASLPYPKRPKPNAENETSRYEITRPSQTRSRIFQSNSNTQVLATSRLAMMNEI